MPMAEILRTSVLGLECPDSLPVCFPPMRVHYASTEVAWLPEPTFTAAPPLTA
jgi:hypothetical protein